VSVQILPTEEAIVLRNPGKDSAQILWPENAPDAPITITRVTMQPGAVSERHHHPVSEQIWMVERGTATLLLSGGQTRAIASGDLVRTAPGVTHGIENTGADVFVYLSITTPPENFARFYSQATEKKQN
jgi:quercetin dioxygenase-like cupin family protein